MKSLFLVLVFGLVSRAIGGEGRQEAPACVVQAAALFSVGQNDIAGRDTMESALLEELRGLKKAKPEILAWLCIRADAIGKGLDMHYIRNELNLRFISNTDEVLYEYTVQIMFDQNQLPEVVRTYLKRSAMADALGGADKTEVPIKRGL